MTERHRGLPPRIALAALCLAACAGCSAAPGGLVDTSAYRAEPSPAQPVVIRALPRSGSAESPPPVGNADARRRQPRALRADDLRLYLDVMRAAAERVRHPPIADATAVRAAQAWSVRMDAASALHAIPPAPLGEATLERAANLEGHMADVQVASERGIDIARYRWIRDTIEAIATQPPTGAVASCDRDGACTATGAAIPAAQVVSREALTSATVRNRRLVSADRAEIRSLAAVVRAGGDPVASMH